MTRSNCTFMETSPFLLLLLLGYCLAVIEGELRCYCNESGCVATGYMCKSRAGQCFTAVEVRGEATPHQTHGCLDTLPEEHRASCRSGMDVVSATKAGSGHLSHMPFLLCCSEHMCNYREDIDVSIILTPKFNGTFQRGSAPASNDNAVYSHNHPGNRDDDRDLWFKAAVIAVPIAGGFILVLLVLLAVRMLKSDARHHRRLIQIRRERSLTKAHMYISDHFAGKSTVQHCSLFNEKSSETCAPAYSDNPASSNGSCPQVYSDSGPGRPCSSASQTASEQRKVDTVNDFKCGHRHHHTASATQCSSDFSDKLNVTCSTTNSDNHSSTTAKPCSFFNDPTAAPSTRHSRDVSVRLDRADAMFPRVSRTEPLPGLQSSHTMSSVATWDKLCERGPTANV